MVAKITLFEPHVEGVQVGPTTLGKRSAAEAMERASESAKRIAVEGTESEGSAGRSRRLPRAPSVRRPRIRSILAAGVAAGVLVGASLAVRRIRSRRAEARGTDEPAATEEPTIEERPAEDLKAE
jgi:hypothetical protein